MYCSSHYIPSYAFSYDTTRLHEIRERECQNYQDEKAREMIRQMKEQRIRENNPSSREPALVSRRMKHLPKPGVP